MNVRAHALYQIHCFHQFQLLLVHPFQFLFPIPQTIGQHKTIRNEIMHIINIERKTEL